MNIPNIYQGLEVEPSQVHMTNSIEQIHLTARIVDPLHFVFIPAKWERELKPYRAAKWKHDFDYSIVKIPAPCHYELKQGVFLAFPQFHMLNGGFYAAHLYAIVKELGAEQAQVTLTVEGLTIESIQDGIKARFTLKPRGLQVGDTPYHAILSY